MLERREGAQIMNLFTPVVPEGRRHPIFTMMLAPQYGPERAVLEQWAADFPDRDGKFAKQFQETFESSFWELYLNACLRSLGIDRDFAFARPDFVAAKAGERFCMEAAIAAPPAGGKPPHGDLSLDFPETFNEFNMAAALRLANSFTRKVKRYSAEYPSL